MNSSASLPPLGALRAFATAARLRSFTAAATELSQTQGAISHSIRELEKRLGVSLFERHGRGIALSQAGVAYLPYVNEALEQLFAGQALLHPPIDSHVLTVSCSPNFAQKWLVPRLGQFNQACPDIDLRISAASRHVTFDGDGIDVAIRHGNGDWPELSVSKLCNEIVFPVCSPWLFEHTGKPIRRISDLARHTLIHDQQREGWRSWLVQLGYKAKSYRLDRGPILSQTSLAIDASIAMQGVALARSALVQLDLRDGRLIRPLDSYTKADFAYWIVAPPGSWDKGNVKQFRDWLAATATADGLLSDIVS